MANVTCELVWVRDLLTKLGFASECPMRLYCDNQIVVHIAEKFSISRAHKTHWNGLLFDTSEERREDCSSSSCFIWSSVGIYLFTKSLGKIQIDSIYDKLGMYDVYTVAWGRLLGNMICI